MRIQYSLGFCTFQDERPRTAPAPRPWAHPRLPLRPSSSQGWPTMTLPGRLPGPIWDLTASPSSTTGAAHRRRDSPQGQSQHSSTAQAQPQAQVQAQAQAEAQAQAQAASTGTGAGVVRPGQAGGCWTPLPWVFPPPPPPHPPHSQPLGYAPAAGSRGRGLPAPTSASVNSPLLGLAGIAAQAGKKSPGAGDGKAKGGTSRGTPGPLAGAQAQGQGQGKVGRVGDPCGCPRPAARGASRAGAAQGAQALTSGWCCLGRTSGCPETPEGSV